MKFGKAFEKTLADENIPDEWVQNSINYKQLKKKINVVVQEMNKLGLTKEYITEHDLELYYQFNERDHHLDKKLIVEQKIEVVPSDADGNDDDNGNGDGDKEQVEVELQKWHLSKDEEFFQTLYLQNQLLVKFSDEEQKEIMNKISSIADVIKQLTLENKNTKDKYLWREIFNLYIEFKLDLNSKFNLVNLNKFIQHVNDTKLIKNSKHTSKNTKIFQNFIDLNMELIRYLTFKNLNGIATRKILKKYDKSTLLKSSESLSILLNHHDTQLINSNSIEQIISTKIVKIVPQLDDYLCPICFQLAYKPIRLACTHVFCLRCMIKLQRKDEKNCPICRGDNVMLADETNLDSELEELMKKQFPKEVKEKKRQNDKELSEDMVKELYGNGNCVIM